MNLKSRNYTMRANITIKWTIMIIKILITQMKKITYLIYPNFQPVKKKK